MPSKTGWTKLKSTLIRFAQSDVIKVLVGNKSDLTEKREVSSEEGQELAKFYGISFLETSAKETVNIGECFLTMSKTVIEKLSKGELNKEATDLHITDINSDRKEVKKGCC